MFNAWQISTVIPRHVGLRTRSHDTMPCGGCVVVVVVVVSLLVLMLFVVVVVVVVVVVF